MHRKRVRQVRAVASDLTMQAQEDNTVGLLVLHPPDKLGVKAGGVHTIDEIKTALSWTAMEAQRVLLPGGATLCIGDPQLLAAWEAAATAAGLRYAGELTVIWDGTRKRGIERIRAMTTSVRWHVKAGHREHGESITVPSSVLICTRVATDLAHAALQLPVELCNFLVTTFSHSRDLIVDPFCGTGSVLVAAELCGRSWIGGDASHRMCEIARQRTSTAGVELERAYLNPLTMWHGVKRTTKV